MTSSQLTQIMRAVQRFHARWHEPGHDFPHVERVAAVSRTIAKREGVPVRAAVAAAYLHNFDRAFEGKSPDPMEAGLVVVRRMLRAARMAPRESATIVEAVRTHSFSRDIRPTNRVGEVLWDADKIDAMGAIGAIRCFEVGARRLRMTYAASDPFCVHRVPDDRQYTLDHFYRKLFQLPAVLCTPTARTMARQRIRWMRQLLAQLAAELAGER
ncbi:HD domain-containing protein [Candidatus Uhrbacteria bacterium]|nr:HD domain-containing protein [Candidatus Uhrbacteria bacterium]